MNTRKKTLIIAAALALLCAAVFAAIKLDGRCRYLLALSEANVSMNESLVTQIAELEAVRDNTDKIKWELTEGKYASKIYDYSWAEENRLVAHAFGAVNVDGETVIYTNSLEAFEQNYALGHRLFEVDFSLTEDGGIVALHDWAQFRGFADLPDTEGYMSMSEFEDCALAAGRLTQMTGEAVIELMAEYPDIYIVTDSKFCDEASVKAQFSQLVWLAEHKGTPEVLDRLIVQIYDQEMLGFIQDVFPCSSIIFTLYQTNDSDEEVLSFCAANGIKVVTMPRGRNTAEFVKSLSEAGIYTYIHAINETFEVAEAEGVGVYGFYTDTLRPSDLA